MFFFLQKLEYMCIILAIINVELGLRIRNSPNSSDTSKFVEIHRRSINRLLMTRKRARAWIIFQSVVRRSVGSIRCRGEKVPR